MNAYLALYRKYRPISFDAVIGQDVVVDMLTTAVREKRISHAYLFCGGRGTGKTSVARIFARDIGCNDEDIIEIDAASNRGIDEIRELRDAVRTAPFSSPYKVYIIDEAHMLTKEAANALLKTLEEPPAHVVFILATTDEHKLPQTIISRCQKIVFNAPSLVTLSQHLLYIAKQEGKTLSEESALLIAKHGKGSYRDALGYLEQALSISQNVVDHEKISALIGQPQYTLIVALLSALCRKDEKEIIAVCQSLRETSDALRTYDELLELIRKGLIARIEGTPSSDEGIALGTTYPTVINSQLILALLKDRHILTVSPLHAWTACEAVLLSYSAL